MSLIDQSDLLPLEKFSPAEIERWLRIGLEGALLKDEGLWAFEHVGLFLGHEDHLVYDLRNVYEGLSPRGQANFRLAVSSLISQLDADDDNFPLLEHLILLAGVFPVREVLSVLPGKIGSGFFGRPEADYAKRLFRLTMQVAAELTSPQNVAASECIRALIGSKHFRNAYAGMALVSLCRAAPDNFAEHMELMRSAIDDMFHQYDVSAEAKEKLARQISNAVGLPVIARDIHKLVFQDPESCIIQNDVWFLESAVFGNFPVLTIENEKVAFTRNPRVFFAIKDWGEACNKHDNVCDCPPSHTLLSDERNILPPEIIDLVNNGDESLGCGFSLGFAEGFKQ